jgi:hypothetical protein
MAMGETLRAAAAAAMPRQREHVVEEVTRATIARDVGDRP